MKLEQLSIFLENRAGRLLEVTRVLAQAGINIRALSLADTSDFGILRLIVSDNQTAKKVLKDQGFTVRGTNVVPVEVQDHPGGLNFILEKLSLEGINVEYMYAFVQRSGINAVLIFRFDLTDQAIDILQKHEIKVLSGEDLDKV